MDSTRRKPLVVGDRWLIAILVVLAFGVLAACLAMFLGIGPGIRPGDTIGHLLGVAGVMFMGVGLAYPLLKRFTPLSSISPQWYQVHLLLGILGAAMAVIHSGGRLGKAPTLVVLASLGILALGVYGRLLAGRLAHIGFAGDPSAFLPASAHVRRDILLLVKEKERLISILDSRAREGTFSLTLSHWMRHPRASATFALLALREELLVLSRRKIPRDLAIQLQRYWRLLHLLLVAMLMLGILAHATMVLFFAGYVAEGGEPYWWYIRK